MCRILYRFANTLFAVVSALVASAFLKSFILLAMKLSSCGNTSFKESD